MAKRVVERKMRAEVFGTGGGTYGVMMFTPAGDSLGAFALPDHVDVLDYMKRQGWIHVGREVEPTREIFCRIVAL